MKISAMAQYAGRTVHRFAATKNSLTTAAIEDDKRLIANAKDLPSHAPLGQEQYPDGASYDIHSYELAPGDMHELYDQGTGASGGPGSLLPASDLDGEGRQFLSGARPAALLSATTGQPCETPFRIYGGLLHAGDVPKGPKADETAAKNIVDKIFAEAGRLTRTNSDGSKSTAADQPLWHLDLTTGSGYVVGEGVNAVENFARGNVTSIALEYNDQPSVLSTRQAKHLGVAEAKYFLKRFNEMCRGMRAKGVPEDKIPKLVVTGESLATDVLFRALEGHLKEVSDPNSDYHIDRMLLTGVPGFVKFPESTLAKGKDVSKDGKWALLDGGEGPDGWVKAMKPGAAMPQYVMCNNPSDPVPRMGSLKKILKVTFFKPKKWQADAPPWKRFSTGLHGVFGIAAATQVAPGSLGDVGHNYSKRKAQLVDFALFGNQAPQDVVDRTIEKQKQDSVDRATQIAAEKAAKGK